MSCFSHQGVGWGGGEGVGVRYFAYNCGIWNERAQEKKKTPNNRGEGLPKFAQE